ncbi:TPA: helix-turn-helix domain-containing protein [Streptococcus suis]
MSVGEKIKQLRKEKGLTMVELGELIGAPQSAISNWEKGDNLPNVGRLKKLADIFGISVEELLGEQTMTTTQLIRNWVHARNIHTAHPKDQFLKVVEEVGEIGAGLARGDRDLIMDAVGDTYVTLVALCETMDVSIEECINVAYDAIKDRTGRLVDGVFIKDEEAE